MKQFTLKSLFNGTVLFLLFLAPAGAQTMASLTKEIQKGEIKTKALRWGVNLNIFWSTFRGSSLPNEYFTKPSLGAGVRAEYYPLTYLGVGAGIAFQQRGAGVIRADYSGGAYSHPLIPGSNGIQGDPDSTHLQKIRISALDVPLAILFRTPKDVVKGIRLSGSAGLLYMYAMQAAEVFESVADGDHRRISATDRYNRHDLGLLVSLGADIHTWETGQVFQIHFQYTEGLQNVFAAGQGSGTQIYYGIRLTCLF